MNEGRIENGKALSGCSCRQNAVAATPTPPRPPTRRRRCRRKVAEFPESWRVQPPKTSLSCHIKIQWRSALASYLISRQMRSRHWYLKCTVPPARLLEARRPNVFWWSRVASCKNVLRPRAFTATFPRPPTGPQQQHRRHHHCQHSHLICLKTQN